MHQCFKKWLAEFEFHSTPDIVWYSGRPAGLGQVGLHGSVWGTSDPEVAAEYGDFEDGSIRSFRLKSAAKTIVGGDKLELLNWLHGHNDQKTKAIDAALAVAGGDDVEWTKILANQYGLQGADGPKGWFSNMTSIDTLIANKLKENGIDAAIMREDDYSPKEIVVVNLPMIDWLNLPA